MSKRCFIAGAGDYSGSVIPGRDDYIIAADGGYSELVLRGIIPDLVVGDFDSLGVAPEHSNVLRTPVEKDDTDMMTAVKEALRLGCEVIIIDGGLGGRVDHSYANFQTLVYIACHNARGYLISRDYCITAIKNSSLSFSAAASGRVSVFCAGSKASGITLSGLKCPLDNATLTFDYPLGVSNEFTAQPATIKVKEGILLVMWTGGLDDLASN